MSGVGGLDVVVEEAGDLRAGGWDDSEGVAADVLGVVAGADEVTEGPGGVGADVESGCCSSEANEAKKSGGETHAE